METKSYRKLKDLSFGQEMHEKICGHLIEILKTDKQILDSCATNSMIHRIVLCIVVTALAVCTRSDSEWEKLGGFSNLEKNLVRLNPPLPFSYSVHART